MVSGRIDFNAPGVHQLLSTMDGSYPPNGVTPYHAGSGYNDESPGTIQLIDDWDDTWVRVLSTVTRYAPVESNPNATRSVADGMSAVPVNVDPEGVAGPAFSRNPVAWPDWTQGDVNYLQLHLRMEWSSTDGAPYPPGPHLLVTDPTNYAPYNSGGGWVYELGANNPNSETGMLPAASSSGIEDVVFDVSILGGQSQAELLSIIQNGMTAFEGSHFLLYFENPYSPPTVGDDTASFTVHESYLTYEYDPFLTPPPSGLLENNMIADLGLIRQVFST